MMQHNDRPYGNGNQVLQSLLTSAALLTLLLPRPSLSFSFSLSALHTLSVSQARGPGAILLVLHTRGTPHRYQPSRRTRCYSHHSF